MSEKCIKSIWQPFIHALKWQISGESCDEFSEDCIETVLTVLRLLLLILYGCHTYRQGYKEDYKFTVTCICLLSVHNAVKLSWFLCWLTYTHIYACTHIQMSTLNGKNTFADTRTCAYMHVTLPVQIIKFI